MRLMVIATFLLSLISAPVFAADVGFEEVKIRTVRSRHSA